MNSGTRITAILLAAGLSRRMGRNKLFLPYKDGTLLSHTLRLIDSFPFFQKIVVINTEASEFPFPAGWEVAVNPTPEAGQSSSMHCGLERAAGEAYMFFTVDQPLLRPETIARLTAAAAPDVIVVPRAGDSPGNPACFGRAFRDELLAATGDAGGRHVRDSNRERCVFVEVSGRLELLDLDTFAQYQALVQDAQP